MSFRSVISITLAFGLLIGTITEPKLPDIAEAGVRLTYSARRLTIQPHKSRRS